MEGLHTGGQSSGKSLTTHRADTLASAVVAKASAEGCDMLGTAAERPDCMVVASLTGSAGG